MWKPINHPGEWRIFQERKDIKGLPIMEARKIYLIEENLYNNLISSNDVNSSIAASAGGNPLVGVRFIKVINTADSRYSGVYDQKIAQNLRVPTNGTVAWAKLQYSIPKGGGTPIPTGNYTHINWSSSFSKWEVRFIDATNSSRTLPFFSPVTTTVNPYHQYVENTSTLQVVEA